jgi:hypothetical protein
MFFEDLAFGSIKVDGVEYDYDILVDCGKIRKRKKGPSKEFHDQFGHTPLSINEKIPWRCRRLVIGTGNDGRLPVLPEVQREAERRKVELVIVQTEQAIVLLNEKPPRTNAILHVTC